MSTITNAWVHVEEAALRLGVSARTVARRIASGDLEARVGADGRRQVLLQVEASLPPIVGEPAAVVPDKVVATAGGDQLAIQARDVLERVLSVVHRQEETLIAHAARARRHAVAGYSLAAALLVAAVLAAVVGTHRLTQATAAAAYWQSQAQDAAEEVEQLRARTFERELAAARAEGELAARLSGPSTQPTTQPSAPWWRQFIAGLGDR